MKTVLKNNSLFFIGMLLSIILLTAFGLLKTFDSKVLDLKVQWLIFAMIPAVLCVFCGGYIKSFKGFGVEVESMLRSPATSIDLKATEAIAEVEGDEKGSYSYLKNLSRAEKTKISRLCFNITRSNYYVPSVISEYISELTSLEYFEIKALTGSFICLLPVSIFVSYKDHINDSNNSNTNSRGLKEFVRALEQGNILEKYLEQAITCTVSQNENLLDIAKMLRAKGLEIVVVIDEKKNFMGVLKRADVERRVVDAVLNAST